MSFNQIKSYHILLFLFCCFLLSNCTIEKRRYTGGFHIEKWHKEHRTFINSEHHEKQPTEESDLVVEETIDHKYCEKELETRVVQYQMKSLTPVPADTFVTKRIHFIDVKKNIQVKRELSKVITSSFSRRTSDEKIIHQSQKQSGVHPDAAKSFLCGLISFGCLFAIIAFGPGNLLLFAGLIVAMLFFAILAGRLANFAFQDMHYARDRYSGKALAAAGMIMGVLSIAAFIGLMLVVLLGITFITFT